MENYTTIQVECDAEGYGITTCPFIYKTEKVLVGGYFCSFFCKFYKGRNDKAKQVYCKLSLEDFKESRLPNSDIAHFIIDDKK